MPVQPRSAPPKSPPTPRQIHIAKVIERNIGTLAEVRRQMDSGRTMQDRVADLITAFSGSMAFLYFHVAWFGGWIVLNMQWFGLTPFDPYPFGLLTMIVSLEAIFLSTFVLISQNRISSISDERSDLDLHIDLLAEYEITKILRLADAIADKLGAKEGKDRELPQLEQIVAPDAVLREIQLHKKQIIGVTGNGDQRRLAAVTASGVRPSNSKRM